MSSPGVLAKVVDRSTWVCHAYCLINHHDYQVVETVEGRLPKGMRYLNGVFTQASSRKHDLRRRLFQGLFKGVLVDKEA